MFDNVIFRDRANNRSLSIDYKHHNTTDNCSAYGWLEVSEKKQCYWSDTSNTQHIHYSTSDNYTKWGGIENIDFTIFKCALLRSKNYKLRS